MQPPLISAYFTTDNYVLEADRLKASLSRLELPAHVIPVAPLGGWGAAVMWKPSFILSQLENNPGRDVFYVDADAEFLDVPDWSLFDGVDASWHVFKRHPTHEAEFLTGTLFFRNTPDVREFVKCWRDRTVNWGWSSTPEQGSLKAEWETGRPALPAKRWSDLLIHRDLPPSLVYVFDDWQVLYPKERAVILHHQASRRLKQAPQGYQSGQ